MKLVKSKKLAFVVISAIIIAGAGVAVIGNQEEPQLKDNKSIDIEEKVEPVSQPENKPVEKEVEVVETVEEVQPTNQTQTFKPDASDNTDNEDVADEPVEKLYGTSFGYGCTKDKVWNVVVADFPEELIENFKTRETGDGWLWKEKDGTRTHCRPAY